MPKELKQVRTKVRANYQTTVGYIGKSAGNGDSGGGSDMHDSTITSEAPDDGRDPNGVMGELPKPIQDYVNKQVSKGQQSQGGQQGQSNGENEQGEDIQQEEPQEKTIGETIAEIFDGNLPPSLQKSAEALQEAIDKHNERTEALQESINKLNEREAEKGEDKSEEHQQNFADTDDEVNTPPEGQEDAENDGKPQGEQSCTEAERAFLDAFMALQEAGSLLGLTPSLQNIAGTGVRNTRIVPVISKVQSSDKQYLTEMSENFEVYDMMTPQVEKLMGAVNTMLKDKGI